MAFGTGVLIGAATFELVGESVRKGGLEPTSIGFFAGAVVFTVFDWYVSKKGGANRKRSDGRSSDVSGDKAGGLGIFIGTVIDAVPESIMIGASLITGAGVSMLLVIAIFISNIPEGLSSTVGLKNGGYSRTKILGLWAVVLLISALASLGGYLFMENAGEYATAIIASFAGGGIMAMIASTMLPEAYDEGGPVIGLMAALGLLASLILDHL